jgi:hypothetical protein
MNTMFALKRAALAAILIAGAARTFAAPDPVWQNLSSKRGEIPAPPGGVSLR